MAKKLGLKAGSVARLIGQPDGYFDLFTDFPDNIELVDEKSGQVNFVHFFTKNYHELLEILPALKRQIKQDGIIWVSWPKKASKVATDITEDKIRNFALESGLVDVKICAVDDVWSGLKLVIRLKDRKSM